MDQNMEKMLFEFLKEEVEAVEVGGGKLIVVLT